MNERTTEVVNGRPAAPPAPASAWESFEKALASALSVLKDEYLVVSTKGGNRFVQFNVCPDEGVFAEAVSNAYLGPAEKLDVGQMADLLSLGWAAPTHEPGSPDAVPAPDGSPNHFREFQQPYSCADVARFAIRTLTGPLRVGNPSELEYRAFDNDGHAVTLPALAIDRDAPPRPKAKPPAKTKESDPFKKLRAKVLAAARTASGQGSLAYDEDGWLQVPVGSRTGWIRINENPWYVRVYVQLMSEVEGGERFLAQIHEMNSRMPLARVIYTDQSVFLGIDFPALPFRAEHLTQTVTLLARFADRVTEDLGGAEKPEKVKN